MKTKEQIQAYNKAYSARPEVREWAKVRNARPERKAVRLSYKQSARGKAADRRSRVKNWERELARIERNRLKTRYGLTPEQYDALLKSQNGLCAICKLPQPTKLHVDHCHKTGKVRGLLCGSCNRALGLLKDNTDFLAAAINYLQ